jgi:hypothetical protein
LADQDVISRRCRGVSITQVEPPARQQVAVELQTNVIDVSEDGGSQPGSGSWPQVSLWLHVRDILGLRSRGRPRIDQRIIDRAAPPRPEAF